MQSQCLSTAITPYVIPLIATFSDIEVSTEPQLTDSVYSIERDVLITDFIKGIEYEFYFKEKNITK